MPHLINVLGPNLMQYAQQQFAGPNVNWYYMDTTALPTEDGDYAGSLSHLIFKHDKGPISNLFDPALMVLLSVFSSPWAQ